MEDTHSTTNKRKKTTSKLIKISIIFFFLLIIVGITVSILLVFIILPSPETTPAPIANTTIPVTTPRTTQPKITTVAPLVNFCLTYQTVDSNIASWARSVCKVQVEVKLLGPQPVQSASCITPPDFSLIKYDCFGVDPRNHLKIIHMTIKMQNDDNCGDAWALYWLQTDFMHNRKTWILKGSEMETTPSLFWAVDGDDNCNKNISCCRNGDKCVLMNPVWDSPSPGPRMSEITQNSMISGTCNNKTQKWTPWTSRSGPGHTGDHERILYKDYDIKICNSPSAMEVRKKNRGFDPKIEHWNMFRHGLDAGFICINDQHPGGQCQDVEVRFCYYTEEKKLTELTGNINLNHVESKIDKVIDERIDFSNKVGSSTTIYGENTSKIAKTKNQETKKSSVVEVTENSIKEDLNESSSNEDNSAGSGVIFGARKCKQYLIKWDGWSHIHNTWESQESLKHINAKGIKKLENYIKKQQELNDYLNSITAEEKEFFYCQIEATKQLNEKYRMIDRIILERLDEENDQEIEYFIKWRGLPYSEATWETSAIILTLFPEKVHFFENRLKNQYTCRSQTRVQRPARFSHPVPKSGIPEWVSEGYRTEELNLTKRETPLELRDYQVDGINWMAMTWVKKRSCILADEMGLGKTIQIINLLAWFSFRQNIHGPHLIIVPLSTLPAWEEEFAKWCPWLNVVVYIGDAKSRETIKQYEWYETQQNRTSRKKSVLTFNVILTTYEMIIRESDFLSKTNWMFIGVDEAHRLKNHESMLYKNLEGYNAHFKVLITGTPLQNSMKELWALLRDNFFGGL